MLHSLVRVSRRVGCSHLGTNNRSARCDRHRARTAESTEATARSDDVDRRPDRSGPARRPTLLVRRIANLSSVAPRLARPEAISFPRQAWDYLPRGPYEPGTTAVGRLPAEMQSCRRPTPTQGLTAPDGEAGTIDAS